MPRSTKKKFELQNFSCYTIICIVNYYTVLLDILQVKFILFMHVAACHPSFNDNKEYSSHFVATRNHKSMNSSYLNSPNLFQVKHISMSRMMRTKTRRIGFMPFIRAIFFLFYFPDLCYTELACTNANGCEILTSGLVRILDFPNQ